MKKILAVLLALMLVMAFVACTEPEETPETPEENVETPVASDADVETPVASDADVEEPAVEPVKVMTHEEYIAAALDTEVVIETYVQAHQSWWDNKVTVYCQSSDGAYFLYELACSEEDAAKLLPGTKIRVTGTKGEWAGEVEVMEGTFEFVEGGDTYIAEAFDATALLFATPEEIIAHQNEFVTFKGMTVDSIEFKNGEPGDDIYVTLLYGGQQYNFCVEYYLTGADTEVYKTVSGLVGGEMVDVEAFLYWYEGMNPHITAVTVVDAF